MKINTPMNMSHAFLAFSEALGTKTIRHQTYAVATVVVQLQGTAAPRSSQFVTNMSKFLAKPMGMAKSRHALNVLAMIPSKTKTNVRNEHSCFLPPRTSK